jgi:hypothetical protein
LRDLATSLSIVIPIALSIVIPIATLTISNMATLRELEAEIILLFRIQGVVLIFLKETVVNCGVGDI